MEDKKEVKEIELGDDKVFGYIKNDKLKAVKKTLLLEQLKHQLFELENGSVAITADGYFYMNRIAGISIITPKTLILPSNEEVPNPYIEINDETKSISKVWVKKYSVGFSPTGVLTVVQSTLCYNLREIFVNELIKIIDKNKYAGRICTKQTVTSEELRSNCSFLTIENDLGVLANFNDNSILKAVEKYQKNIMFADRKAQTICERICLKKHPALSVPLRNIQGYKGGKTGEVTIIGYIKPIEENEIYNALQQDKNVFTENSFSEEDIISSSDIEEYGEVNNIISTASETMEVIE